MSLISSDAQQQAQQRESLSGGKQHNKGILKAQTHEISKIATGCHHL